MFIWTSWKISKHTLETEDEFRAKIRSQELIFEQFVIDIMSDESSEGEFSDDENAH